MAETTTDQTLGELLLGHPDADWSVTRIQPGTIDRETGQEIPPGWWITAHSPGEPEDVWLNLHVDYAVDPEGDTVDEQIARRLLAMLTSPQAAEVEVLRAQIAEQEQIIRALSDELSPHDPAQTDAMRHSYTG
jgi:hypothetical protein